MLSFKHLEEVNAAKQVIDTKSLFLFLLPKRERQRYSCHHMTFMKSCYSSMVAFKYCISNVELSISTNLKEMEPCKALILVQKT